MKKYKKIVNIKKIDENNNIEEIKRESIHYIKTWQELTREEKEKEIEKRQESIYESYQELLYEDFKNDLENIKIEFKNIDFENIYIDSNSQGWWIDSIKNFKYNPKEDLKVFNEYIYIDSIDLKIRKYIDDFTIYIDTYGIEEKIKKIEKTKKYKKWIESINDDIKKWIESINEICQIIGDGEFYSPYNLDNINDKDFFDWYFEDEEFEYIEEVK